MLELGTVALLDPVAATDIACAPPPVPCTIAACMLAEKLETYDAVHELNAQAKADARAWLLERLDAG